MCCSPTETNTHHQHQATAANNMLLILIRLFSISTKELKGSYICDLQAHHLQAHQLSSLGSITESDSAYYNICLSVRLCVHLLHSCTLLKMMDRMRCHLAGTLVVPSNIVLDRGHSSLREGKI